MRKTFYKITYNFLKSELNKAQIEITPKESGREGVDFIIKTNTEDLLKVYLQPINLDSDKKVKIPKLELGEPFHKIG